MALFKATQVVNKQQVMVADRASDLIPIFGDFAIPAGFATNDVVEMVPLPAGYVPVDVIVDNAALGTTMTCDVGLLSGDFDSTGARTCGAQFMTAQAGQTAGIKRMAVAGGGRVAPTTNTRGIGFAFTSVSTPTVGAVVRLTLLCRPAVEGV
jgi:hypothetical protein